MFRLFFYAVLFYLIYKIVRIISGFLTSPTATDNGNVKNPEKSGTRNSNYNIQQKDIIEADFKEIKDDGEKKPDS